MCVGYLQIYGTGRKDIIDRVTRTELRADGSAFRTVTKSLRGMCLWAVQESFPPVGPPIRFIALYLLGGDAEGWGYRDMSEDSGPYHHSCPFSYLDLAPIVRTECAADWRQRVRTYHAMKQTGSQFLATLQPKDEIRLSPLYGSREYVILARSSPTRLSCYGKADGERYRLTRKVLIGAMLLTERAIVAPVAEPEQGALFDELSAA